MCRKFNFLIFVIFALLAITTNALEADSLKDDVTEAPKVDMPKEIDSITESTTAAATIEKVEPMNESPKSVQIETKKAELADSQKHTVADFIIHPLIAFKPRTPTADVDVGEGKQATSQPTQSPWHLFSFNAGQSIGSQMSSLAGSVSGWFNNRLQFPGFVETPVRESKTSTSTTTSTTQRPEIIVRVEHQSGSNKPIATSLNNRRLRPARPARPNQQQFNFAPDEYIDNGSDEDDIVMRDEREDGDDDLPQSAQAYNEEDDEQVDSYDDEDDDDIVEADVNVKPLSATNKRQNRRPVQYQNNKKKYINTQFVRRLPQRTRQSSSLTNKYKVRQRDQYEDENDNDNDNDNDNVDDRYYDDEEDENIAYNNNQYFYQNKPSTRRSQNRMNIFQRGSQTILDQIRQLTRFNASDDEQTPPIRESTPPLKTQIHPQQIFLTRNGETIFVSPDIYVPNNERISVNQFPQPPLTKPLRTRGQTTQYITIPWAQLGISPPEQVVAITEGIQSKPLILKIPQHFIGDEQQDQKKNPVMTPDVVPLLAEASLMNIFQTKKQPIPVVSPIATLQEITEPNVATAKKQQTTKRKTKSKLKKKTTPVKAQRTNGSVGGHTIVEKSPASLHIAEQQQQQQQLSDLEHASTNNNKMSFVSLKNSDALRNADSEYIIVGEDNEAGINRHVQPVIGEGRFIQVNRYAPVLQVLPNGRHFAYRKEGRALKSIEPETLVKDTSEFVVKPIVSVASVEPIVPDTVGPIVKSVVSIPAVDQMVAVVPGAAVETVTSVTNAKDEQQIPVQIVFDEPAKEQQTELIENIAKIATKSATKKENAVKKTAEIEAKTLEILEPIAAMESAEPAEPVDSVESIAIANGTPI